MQKLPIGIQTFSQIVKNNYIYIDKTKEAYELIDGAGKYFFLSRPRRFGKSLFIDTLKEIFEGNKELFKGLYIYDKYDFEKYPVIKIDWAGDFKTLDSTYEVAYKILEDNQKRLGIDCPRDDSPSICFNRLIQETYEKYQKPVVILIDEYDKPILDNIENTKRALENRDFLRSFYVMMKSNDAYIKFAFLTGISKFSKASIFSGLNNLTDISLMKKFGNICGYTHEDLKKSFSDYTKDVDLDKVKEWYNGYYFLKDKIYNPFDILQFFANDKLFKNYWWESGNPYFLIELIKKNHYFLPKLSNLKVDDSILSTFEVDKIKIEVLLYQAGYLTIDRVEMTPFDTIEYRLRLPNKEIKLSFNNMLIQLFNQDAPNSQIRANIYNYLLNANMEGLKETLTTLFASIPYNNYIKNEISSYEGFYASVIYVYLQSLGIEIIGEDVTNKGRIDLTLFIKDKIYIIEFKVVKDVGLSDKDLENSALKQIKERNYHQKYRQKASSQNIQIYLVGIEFSQKDKNIKSLEWERV